MATEMIMQLNTKEESIGYFERIPRCWYGKGYTPSAIELLGQIFSHQGVGEQGATDKYCRMSYNQAKEKLGITDPTIRAGLLILTQKGEIEVVLRDKDGTGYKCIEEYAGKKYDVLPEYLLKATFLIEGKMRKLTNAERRILVHIMTLAEYKKNDGAAEGSALRFSRTLHLAEKTVRSALKVLLKAGLIFRRKEEKGVNGHKLSKYRPNKRLYDYKKAQKKARVEREPQLPAAVQAANARADRERYYAMQQMQNRNRAERYISMAMSNARYKQVDGELRRLQLPLAKAEIFNKELYIQLKKQAKALHGEKAALLATMNISPEWLDEEHFCACKACKDKGVLPNGKYCDCYLKE